MIRSPKVFVRVSFTSPSSTKNSASAVWPWLYRVAERRSDDNRLTSGKDSSCARTALARELTCFVRTSCFFDYKNLFDVSPSKKINFPMRKVLSFRISEVGYVETWKKYLLPSTLYPVCPLEDTPLIFLTDPRGHRGHPEWVHGSY